MKPIASLSLALVFQSSIALFAAAPPAPAGEKPKVENTVEKKEELAAKCPICDKEANPKCTVEYEGKTYAFHSGECREKWNKQRAESLYQRIGGKAAMDAAIDGFYKRVLADERINGFFEDVDMKRQARKQKAFLSAAFGGPEPWKGKDLRTAHKNLDGLKDSHFNAVAENLQATLAELKVDEKLIAEVMAIAGSVRDEVLNRKKEAAKGTKKDPEEADKPKASE